jgi:Rod binding domain-containing protein
MMDNGAIPPAGGTLPASSDLKRLPDGVHQLEGVFVQKCFRAMRETVAQERVIDGAGAEMFTGMCDEEISVQVPAKCERGIGEAPMRQPRRALSEEARAPETTASRSRTA